MDSERFDRFTRVLASTPSRRAVSRAVAGLALTGALVAAPDDAAEARKRKKCKPCQTKKRGKCGGQKPEGAACNGTGQCFDGACNPRPECLSAGAVCTAGTAADCCSGVCLGGTNCQNSGEGNPCLASSDCLTGLDCIAYVCRPA